MAYLLLLFFFIVLWITVDNVMLLSFFKIFISIVGILNTYTMKAYIPKVLSDLKLWTHSQIRSFIVKFTCSLNGATTHIQTIRVPPHTLIHFPCNLFCLFTILLIKPHINIQAINLETGYREKYSLLKTHLCTSKL